VLAIPLDRRRRILLSRQANSLLRNRPIEQAGQNLAVAVGRLWGEPPARHLPADKGGDVRCADLLEAVGLDDRSLAASVLARLRGPLLGFVRDFPARDSHGIAHRPKRIAEIVDVGLCTFRRLHRANVGDVGGEHIGNRGLRRKRIVVAPGLRRLKLPQFVFCDLQRIGAGGSTFRLTGDHVLNVVGIATKNKTRHGGTPFGMKEPDLASPLLL
jgi:hypothetical protein